MLESARTVDSFGRVVRMLLGAGTALTLGLSLSGCLVDHVPPANVAIQRDGNGVRVAFCESVRVDELWVDQWISKRVQVWEAKPRVRVEPGDVLDRASLGTSLTELADFDFESGDDVSITIIRPTETSQETRFSLRNGLPDDRWLLPDGKTAQEPCPNSHN